MKNFGSKMWAAAMLATIALLSALPWASAQTVVQVPTAVSAGGTVTDFGNGPMKVRVLTGNTSVFTSSGSGVGSTSGSSTTLTLTSTAAANPPCVGCGISGTGITAGTTVASFNGTTVIGMSAAMTVASGTAVAWGKACPASSAGARVMLQQPGGADTDLPLYTYARICGGSTFTAGASVVTFPITTP